MPLAGGVLSDVEIRQRVTAEKELIVNYPLENEALRPAAYDVHVAADGLIMPDRRKVAPGEAGFRPRKIVLQPGDAALLSTAEEFRLPMDIAGNVSIKNYAAAQGLMLLSGMLIDPGYGLDAGPDSGSRIFLQVANIGEQAIEIRPEEDRIASVQFLLVRGGHDGHTHKVPSSKWTDQTLLSLYFLTDMKNLKSQIERSDARSQEIVMFGFVVLAVALIGTALTTMLSIAQKAGALTYLHRLEAHETGVLLLLGIVAAILLIFFTALRAASRMSVGRLSRHRQGGAGPAGGAPHG